MTRLPRTLVNRLLSQAQQSAEIEVCGLIGRDAEGRLHVYPVPNVAREPGRLFQMDPAGQIDAMRRMREGGESLFAIYHSHPHAPAEPSATDLQEAAYPEALYLIISLNTEGVLEMRGYRLGDGHVRPVELEVVEE
ncbi:M67 family metallopeptidase [Thiohalobacter sp. IOR34]|uniref:M67 family metallopeptidase n=1 Tax=Thiohalobacter sp. IOR34 TaxID=3057176 RepID=UPI0025B13585|nr:M67 family metallopeptidase [Thiohalobacter sp. IOR34]WJW75939.1 M67 family metallopeptidase [Thiohalobacter sp. IOR34]